MMISLNKNQVGLGIPLIIALVVVILGVAGGAYYMITKNGDSTSSTVNKEAEAECNKKTDDKDLCKFASNFTLGGDYTAVIKGTSEGKTSQITVKYDGENYESTTEVDGVTTATMIYHDKATYINTEGKWIKYPASEETADTTGDLAQETEPDLELDDTDFPKYTKAGKEACGDLSCFRYDFADPEVPNSSYSMWFDDKEYKLRKIVSTGDEGSVEITYTYGDVTVTPPADYEELPSFGDGTGLTDEQIQQLMEQYGQ